MSLRIVCAAIAFTLLPGCSILGGGSPLPARLDVEEQANMDQGWLRFVATLDHVDRTALLDTVLFTQSWHKGVDRLYLVAERQVGNMRIVTESQFERTHPELDTFTVRFLSRDGRVVREDVFGREAIDTAIELAMTNDPAEPVAGEDPAAFLDRQMRIAERDARMARVQELFASESNTGADPIGRASP